MCAGVQENRESEHVLWQKDSIDGARQTPQLKVDWVGHILVSVQINTKKRKN